MVKTKIAKENLTMEWAYLLRCDVCSQYLHNCFSYLLGAPLCPSRERTRLNQEGSASALQPALKKLCSKFQANPMHWRRCGACGRFSDAQLISSLILLGTGGVVSRVSTSEWSEVVGLQKYLVSRRPYYYYYYDYVLQRLCT